MGLDRRMEYFCDQMFPIIWAQYVIPRELTYPPKPSDFKCRDIPSSLIELLTKAIWVQSKIAFHHWIQYLRTYRYKMISSPKMFVMYATFPCNCMAYNTKDHYERFITVCALLVGFGANFFYSGNPELIQYIPKILAVFFERNMKESFYERGGWRRLDKYLLRQPYLSWYEETIVDIPNETPDEKLARQESFAKKVNFSIRETYSPDYDADVISEKDIEDDILTIKVTEEVMSYFPNASARGTTPEENRDLHELIIGEMEDPCDSAAAKRKIIRDLAEFVKRARSAIVEQSSEQAATDESSSQSVVIDESVPRHTAFDVSGYIQAALDGPNTEETAEIINTQRAPGSGEIVSITLQSSKARKKRKPKNKKGKAVVSVSQPTDGGIEQETIDLSQGQSISIAGHTVEESNELDTSANVENEFISVIQQAADETIQQKSSTNGSIGQSVSTTELPGKRTCEENWNSNAEKGKPFPTAHKSSIENHNLKNSKLAEKDHSVVSQETSEETKSQKTKKSTDKSLEPVLERKTKTKPNKGIIISPPPPYTEAISTVSTADFSDKNEFVSNEIAIVDSEETAPLQELGETESVHLVQQSVESSKKRKKSKNKKCVNATISNDEPTTEVKNSQRTSINRGSRDEPKNKKANKKTKVKKGQYTVTAEESNKQKACVNVKNGNSVACSSSFKPLLEDTKQWRNENIEVGESSKSQLQTQANNQNVFNKDNIYIISPPSTSNGSSKMTSKNIHECVSNQVPFEECRNNQRTFKSVDNHNKESNLNTSMWTDNKDPVFITKSRNVLFTSKKQAIKEIVKITESLAPKLEEFAVVLSSLLWDLDKQSN